MNQHPQTRAFCPECGTRYATPTVECACGGRCIPVIGRVKDAEMATVVERERKMREGTK